MRKKFLAVLLSCSMVFSLAACSSDNKPTNKETVPSADAEASLDDIIPKETVTLDVFTQLANYSGEQVGWFAELMLKKFNVKLNIIPDPADEGVFATRMESGNLGDIVIFGGDMDKYNQSVQKGMLFDWNEEDILSDYGPYIKEHMSKALEQNANISGGKTYGFGYDVGTSPKDLKGFDYHPDLRYDLYKEIGSPKINTLEDYIPVLEKMQKACPKSDSGKQTYGVSLFPDWDGDMVMFVKSTAALYGWEEFGFGLYNVNTQEFQDCLRDDSEYLRCLKFYNQLHRKGLLDPDSSTQTYQNVVEDYTDGSAFFNLFSWMGAIAYNTPEHLEAGKAMLAVPAEDSKPLVNGCNIYGNDRIWTIGANTEYPELCMAIINWLCTPEGVLTNDYGPKGVTWDYTADKKTEFTELGKQTSKDENTVMTGGYTGTFKDGRPQYNLRTWAMDAQNPETDGEVYNKDKWESELNAEVSKIQQTWRDDVGAPNANEYLEKRPYSLILGTTYTRTTKDDELQVIWNQVATCIKENSWKAIYSKTDAEYDACVKTMQKKTKEYGYDKCIEYLEKEAANRKAAEDEVKALMN